jgi:MraZ protein
MSGRIVVRKMSVITLQRDDTHSKQ